MLVCGFPLLTALQEDTQNFLFKNDFYQHILTVLNDKFRSYIFMGVYKIPSFVPLPFPLPLPSLSLFFLFCLVIHYVAFS